MDLFDILKMRGFDMQAKTKVLRHQDRRFDIEKLFRDGLIEAYQSVCPSSYKLSQILAWTKRDFAHLFG